MDYQPSFNGNPITTPNQLTAVMNYTTYFTLDSALTPSSACCTLSYGFSLDKDVSSSIVSLGAYLTLVQAQVPTCAPQNPIELLAENPSLLGTGWQMTDITFNPAALEAVGGPYNGQLCAGVYELVLSVDGSMIGPASQSAVYPATLQMHFDDIGLALQEPNTAYFTDNSRGILWRPRRLCPRRSSLSSSPHSWRRARPETTSPPMPSSRTYRPRRTTP